MAAGICDCGADWHGIKETSYSYDHGEELSAPCYQRFTWETDTDPDNHAGGAAIRGQNIICLGCGAVLSSYTPNIHTVTVFGGTGGGDYAEGAGMTVTANAPETGKRFAAWTGADGLTFISGSAATATAAFTVPANTVTLTATYEDIPYNTVSLSAAPENSGTVTGPGSYEKSTAVTVTAAANEGYAFVNRTENNAQVSTDASYSFTVTEDRSPTGIPSVPAVRKALQTLICKAFAEHRDRIRHNTAAGTLY